MRIFTAEEIEALRGLGIDELLGSHEALRKQARMGWEAAQAMAGSMDDAVLDGFAQCTFVEH